jgi:DNA-binding GntR family transcriptional regulator
MADERFGYRLVPELTPEFEEPATTLAGQAHAAIRKRILTADLAPGSLINERALMEDMAFGRTPVREALLRLASEKLVIFRANQAIQVAPIGFEEVRELYEVRLHAERLAWRLWHRHRTEADIEMLSRTFEAAERMIAENRAAEIVNLDFDFHAHAWRQADNRFLAHHLYNLGGLSYRLWYLTTERTPERMRSIVRLHDPVIAAFKGEDSNALDRAVADHIIEAFEFVMERLKGHGLNAARNLPIRELLDDAAR